MQVAIVLVALGVSQVLAAIGFGSRRCWLVSAGSLGSGFFGCLLMLSTGCDEFAATERPKPPPYRYVDFS